MDKLRDVFAFLNKYGFWISCALVALIVLGLWYQSTGTIQEETKKYTSELNGKQTSLMGIQKKKPHPNATTEAEMQKQLELYGLEVAKGWDTVYARQKDVLTWPDKLVKARGNFGAAVKNLRPIEIVPFPTPPDKQEMLAFNYRQQYRDWIELVIPDLAKHIGAEWSVKDGTEEVTTRPMGTRPGELGPSTLPPPPLPLVDWATANQQEIMLEHFPFTQPEAPTPTTLEVLYAQETLWVLESLVGIVKEVNGDAEARYQTAIHGIESIQVGKTAGGVSGVVTPLIDPNAPVAGLGAGAGAEYGRNPLGTPTTGPVPPGQPPVPGGDQPMDATKLDPAEGRYVDQNYLPLTAARLRAAITTAPSTPEDVVLAVAKRMPVRMRLKVDQRKINVLLAACGNSPLPLEVRQVRINRDPASATGSGSSNFAMPPAYRPSGLTGERPRMPIRPPVNEGGRSPIPGQSGPNAPEVDPNEITLEVFGIVYIFNPVNTALLGITDEQLKSMLEQAGVPVNPVAVPPAAPPAAGPVANPAVPAAPVPNNPAVPAVPPGPAALNPNSADPLAAAPGG